MLKEIKKLFRRINLWMDFNPPGALTSRGWRLFKEEFKEQAPIRYYIKHNLKYKFMPIKWKYDSIRNWIHYRIIDRLHIVKTGLNPAYYDIDTRMLHANFTLLKDFVEIEQAWDSYVWTEEYKKEPRWKRYVPFIYSTFRRPDLGIKHFEWASTLDDPNLPPHERSEQQAKDAREILILYKWWTQTRPERKEADIPDYSDQGLGLLGVLDDDFNRDAEDYKNHITAMARSSEQEDEWRKEDDEMLIRLIKIRRALWT